MPLHFTSLLSQATKLSWPFGYGHSFVWLYLGGNYQMHFYNPKKMKNLYNDYHIKHFGLEPCDSSKIQDELMNYIEYFFTTEVWLGQGNIKSFRR